MRLGFIARCIGTSISTLIVVVGLAGCGSGNSSYDACNAYLTCLASADPSQIAAAEAAYGAGSACWANPQAAAACAQQCTTAKAGFDCGCAADGDCTQELLHHCDTTTHQCVSCLQDGDCRGGLYCDAELGKCQTCRTSDNAGCSSGAPYCVRDNQQEDTCIPCDTDGHACKNGGVCVAGDCDTSCNALFMCVIDYATVGQSETWSTALGTQYCPVSACGAFSPLRDCLLQNCAGSTAGLGDSCAMQYCQAQMTSCEMPGTSCN